MTDFYEFDDGIKGETTAEDPSDKDESYYLLLMIVVSGNILYYLNQIDRQFDYVDFMYQQVGQTAGSLAEIDFLYLALNLSSVMRCLFRENIYAVHLYIGILLVEMLVFYCTETLLMMSFSLADTIWGAAVLLCYVLYQKSQNTQYRQQVS